MIKSDPSRASVAAALQRKAREAETARAIGEGRRDVIRGPVVADDELQRACKAIISELGRERGWVAGRSFRTPGCPLRRFPGPLSTAARL
jgi:hypothetical protein